VGGRRSVPPKLAADEQSEQCGWLKDKYGVSWQIVPSVLPEMMNSKEPQNAIAFSQP
jgi:predicted 3-demethylubiquinone-9 3-methyltransferase (glyoxalase superfamily)